MAHPLVWPGEYYFYPIGNTPAVSLARDLAPEEHANILLLGCGDPRNVLFTIYCEPTSSQRKLDFTCCDVDPAILARNVLLLTLIADKYPTTTMWNIFYHMYLDDKTYTSLVDQCKRLIHCSDDLEHWRASSYGSFIRMCTAYTLAELRRHWTLYVDMRGLPTRRIAAIRDAFSSRSASARRGIVLSTARSAGPLMLNAIETCSEHFERYWKTGVTFSDDKAIAVSNLVNPTFAYSLGGEEFSVQYGVDPLMSFHLAAVFGNAKASVTIDGVVDGAKAEFREWCTAILTAITSTASPVPVIRCFVGEASAICGALWMFTETGTLSSNVPVAPWKTTFIQLDTEYRVRGAPSTFNVIDTSNLDDHIGPLNVLIISIPLLSPSQSSSILYTESLLHRNQNATKEFAEHLYADLTTIGMLLGFCPVDYLSGFTTRSNFHELLMYQTVEDKPAQYHQVTTWRSPASGDVFAARSGRVSQPPVFDAYQLGTILYDIYYQMFEQEDANHFLSRNQGNLTAAFAKSNLVHYIRESFVLLLKLVRDRLKLSPEQWLEVMDRFFHLEDANQTLKMDTVNYQDFCTQIHRHGVHKPSFYDIKAPKLGRFSSWETIPTLVRIILVVPREALDVLNDSAGTLRTPLLQCDIRGTRIHNIFSSVHAAFGRVIPMGSQSNPRAVFQDDPDGWKGTLPLVVSFAIAARYLTEFEPMEQLYVCLSVRSTAASTMVLSNKLGIQMNLFKARLMDESRVYVLPEYPLSAGIPPSSPSFIRSAAPGSLEQIGSPRDVAVGMDEDCELVTSLTCRICIEDTEVKHLLSTGAMPCVSQVSPCTMRLSLGDYKQDVIYPMPVVGSQTKLRVARKSLYIEVVVPPYGPLVKQDGMRLCLLPVVPSAETMGLWNIHRVNLPLLPILDLDAHDVEQWLNTHASAMFSRRDKSVLKKNKEDDVLLLVKDSLFAIFVRSAGMQKSPVRRMFALRDMETKDCDTILFIDEIRFDLQSHTLVWDGYVLPLTPQLMEYISVPFGKLVEDICQVSAFKGEMRAWKQILPALVERCRMSWKHGANCEYRGRTIPLSDEMHSDPLCSCGRGKNTEGMLKSPLWKNFAPYVTRVALSPLFAVSYLETVIRDPASQRCYACRGKGIPKLKACGRCKKVRYCSEACQKNDWKSHKPRCIP